MWVSRAIVCFVLLFAQAWAQHVHFVPPEVERIVSSIKTRYRHYYAFFNGHGYFNQPGPAQIIESPFKPYKTTVAPPAATSTACDPYWFEQIKHQGKAPFDTNSTYQVWRNVKDFGAKGDGAADDTAAINAAISSGGRCAPGTCQSSTKTPATVYFPPGKYKLSSSIIDYYFTNLIGHPTCLPVLKATSNFTGLGIIDGDQYQSNGALGFGSTNIFYRQIRNFIIDTTGVPANTSMTGVHWPTAQATSLQNVEFRMSAASGTQHQGLFIEEGSGGYMGDLQFYGGLYGMNIGNQQFTMRAITISNAVTAINQMWDWGWTYSGITISQCGTGFNISASNRTAQAVTSITLIDSTISDTSVGILTAHDSTSQPASAGSIIMENVHLRNVATVVKEYTNRTVLAGSSGFINIAAWGEGHSYTPSGPKSFENFISANRRPTSLTTYGNSYYSRSKPQYEDLPVSNFVSVRTAGAKGDGMTDDTAALQAVIKSAHDAGKIVFFDAGYYKVTKTLYIPSGSRITGESYPVIMSSGSYFADMKAPKPVVQVGEEGEEGSIEWSDMIVSTQGAQAGAILIQFNLAASATAPSGMWDVHVRIGGFAGSGLQVAQCPTTPDIATPPAAPKSSCISGFISMHVTPSAAGLYMENCWIWTADHDLDDANSTQITVYSGRGLLVECSEGNVWLVGTAVEHHSLYQYQFTNTKNVFMGQIQTETAYYQPNPDARIPFPTVASLHDPTFTASSSNLTNSTSNTANGLGLRITDSESILVYGAGLYSFFDNYSTNCSQNQLVECQTRIFSLEGSADNVNVYGLNTVGTSCMVSRDGNCQVFAKDNVGNFVDTIALYRPS